jgi:hypothetical protein
MAKSRLMRSALGILGLGLLGVTVTACGFTAQYFTPPPSTTTLMLGWERRFSLDWTVTPAPDGSSRVEGYVNSLDGERAMSLRVMARAVDAQGHVVGQQIAWVPEGVPAFSRTYFAVPRLPQAESYVVTVWDFTLFQSPSNFTR